MEWDAVVWLILGILGSAFIVGGIVAYRGSGRTSVRAFSAAAISAGVVMWVVILITVPVSRTGDGPSSPTVEKAETLTALTQ